MSRVAEGHFQRNASVLDIEGKHVTIQGSSPDSGLSIPPLYTFAGCVVVD
jgi:hypothetical protein